VSESGLPVFNADNQLPKPTAMKLSDLLERRRKRNPNKIDPDQLTMNALVTLLTTSRGWLLRQAVKATALVSAPLAVWLEANGQGDHVGAITAGIVAVVSALIEVGLSFLSRKNK